MGQRNVFIYSGETSAYQTAPFAHYLKAQYVTRSGINVYLYVYVLYTDIMTYLLKKLESGRTLIKISLTSEICAHYQIHKLDQIGASSNIAQNHSHRL